MIPAELCISNGFSCIQSAYPTPTDAVRIEAENRFKGGDRAPYYIMDRRASLKHLKVGEVNANIRSIRVDVMKEFLMFVERVFHAEFIVVLDLRLPRFVFWFKLARDTILLRFNAKLR